MLNLKTLRASGVTALLLGTVGAASAADMLSAPPPPPPVPAAAALSADSGFYLRGDIGMSSHGGAKPLYTAPAAGVVIGSTSGRVEETGHLDVGVGYQVNSWLRGDITAEYRRPARYRLMELTTTDPFTPAVTPLNPGIDVGRGKIGGMVGLANIYVDLGTWNRITPFVGVGFGLAHLTVSGVTDMGLGPYAGGFGTATSHTKTNFAWAAHAGLGYDLGSNWKAEVAYRYLNMGKVASSTIVCLAPCAPFHMNIKTFAAHEMRFGLRYMFADAGPAPSFVPGPLVRKY